MAGALSSWRNQTAPTIPPNRSFLLHTFFRCYKMTRQCAGVLSFLMEQEHHAHLHQCSNKQWARPSYLSQRVLPFFRGVEACRWWGLPRICVVWFLGPTCQTTSHHLWLLRRNPKFEASLTVVAPGAVDSFTTHCLWGSIQLKTCSMWHVRQTDTYSRLIIMMALILLWAPQPSILLRWWGRLHFPWSWGFLSWNIFIPVPIITSTLWPGKQGNAVSSWLTWIWVT